MAYYNRSRSSGFSKSRSYTPRAAQTPVEFRPPTFQPSPYQSEIVRFIREQTGSLIVDAVAGSGKTSTLQLIVAAILDMGASYVVVAFNKPIATELQARGMNGRTFHSLGYSCVTLALTQRNNGVRPELDAQKVQTIVADEYQDADGFASALIRIVSLMKNHGMRPNASDDDIIGLIDHFDLEWDDESISESAMCAMARNVLAINNRQTRVIDFDDQLYFVHLLDLKMPTFDFILVDESQDTNPLRRSLVARMMHTGSRVVAVGDERQAIYGFTGASHDSMQLIADQFSCARLPLSVSYRCARSVVEYAQRVVPHILPRDGAPEGAVRHYEAFKRSDFLPTDLIVCRNTAPLVGVAYKLLAARIPCKIMGREIGKSLTSLIKKLTRKNETLESLADRLLAHKTAETEKAIRQKKEAKAQSIQDKVDAILAILDSMTPEDVERGIPGLVAIIDSMFADQKNGCTTLATVHKSKGLEAPRVFVLDPKLMPSKMAKQEWQVVQEHNLRYVAYTRALDELCFVDSKNLTD